MWAGFDKRVTDDPEYGALLGIPNREVILMAEPLFGQGISNLWLRTQLQRSSNDIATSMDRLATGLKITKSADDPSGQALSRAGFGHRMGNLQAAIENVEMGINFADLRFDGLMNTQDLMYRLRDLCVRGANDATLTSDDRDRLQIEVDGLLEALNGNRYISFNDAAETLFDPGKLDVVWVIDQTGSMGAPIAAVALAAPDMYAKLKEKGFDLRMGAVGYYNGGTVNPAAAPTASPYTTLSATGTRQLQSDSATFVADVNAIAGALGGTGQEPGLEASLEAIYATGIDAQLTAEPDAQRVFILLTDTDSDDNGDTGFGAEDNGFNTTVAQRDHVVDVMNSWNIDYYVVNSITEGGHPYPGFGQDQDFVDVATRAGGSAMNLDPANAWVDTISTQLEAYGGPWDMIIHEGPDMDEYEEYRLNTVVPTTLGISGLNMSTAGNALNSLSAMDDAFVLLDKAIVETGTMRAALQRTLDIRTEEYLQLANVNSRITDVDMAEEIATYAKTTLLQDTTISAMTHSNAQLESLSTLMGMVLNGSSGKDA